jgi:choline dehydrogenase
LISTENGRRNGAREFIVAVRDAENWDGSKKYPLDVKLDTHVTRVMFDTESNPPRATGVEYLEGKYLYRAHKRSGIAGAGRPGSVRATREVIVAGGSYNSPQILKLSGVGPREELEQFGIPVIVDSPGVGAKLQDHYEISVLAETPNDHPALAGCTFGVGEDPCLETWRTTPRLGSIWGSAYDSGGFGAAIFYKSSQATKDNFDIIALAGPAEFKGYFPNYSVNSTTDHNKWSWVILKAHPRSSAGAVTLRSADPLDVPHINFEFFEGEGGDKDLQAMYEGVQFGRDAYARTPVPNTELLPGPNRLG